ncbi:MAG: cupin domain-containing protein [Clostridiales bacterium]|jgi:quercetin dioxygenase-like cupin family protein|nr:cupin domain-containing protein [Clostridiales bacterium]
MISYEKDRTARSESNLRGGEGVVDLTPVFPCAIPHMRLFSVITLPPGASIGMHKHEKEAEAYYVLEGDVVVRECGGDFTLGTGEAHLCSDGESHALLNQSGAVAKLLAIIPTETR